MTHVRRAQERHEHSVFTATEDGYAPGPGSANGYFLRDDGLWAAAGSGTFGPNDRRVGRFNHPQSRQLHGIAEYTSGTSLAAGTVSDTGTGIASIPHSRWAPGGTARGYWSSSNLGSMTQGFTFAMNFGWYVNHPDARLELAYKPTVNANDYAYNSLCVQIDRSLYGGSGKIQWLEDDNSTTRTGYYPDNSVLTDTGWTAASCSGDLIRLEMTCVAGSGEVDATLTRSSDGAQVSHTYTVCPDSDLFGSYATPWALRCQLNYYGSNHASRLEAMAISDISFIPTDPGA